MHDSLFPVVKHHLLFRPRQLSVSKHCSTRNYPWMSYTLRSHFGQVFAQEQWLCLWECASTTMVPQLCRLEKAKMIITGISVIIYIVLSILHGWLKMGWA
ncbi:hypothetical protein BJX61DRAFT_148046 [Aspergillus egyptiacus]|nr:hypothetical protein BJX61DRAFT_148046 [Aspergillus egyptiacus]